MKDHSSNNIIDRAWLWHRKGGPMLRDQEIAAQLGLGPGGMTNGLPEAIKLRALKIRRDALAQKLARINAQIDEMEGKQ